MKACQEAVVSDTDTRISSVLRNSELDFERARNNRDMLLELTKRPRRSSPLLVCGPRLQSLILQTRPRPSVLHVCGSRREPFSRHAHTLVLPGSTADG
jgi:hypothetical protein